MRSYPRHVANSADFENLLSVPDCQDFAVTHILDIYGLNGYSEEYRSAMGLATIGSVFSVLSNFSADIALTNPIVPQEYALKWISHCHTTESDGAATPAQIVTSYESAGIDVVSITDHDVLTADPEISGIIFLQGIEITAGVAHKNQYTGISGLCLNHPEWQYARAPSMLPSSWIGGYIEVFNEIEWELDAATSDSFWDSYMEYGIIYAMAGADNHNLGCPVYPHNVLYCDENSLSGAIAAIESGNFYPTSGNDISISIDGDVITATSSVSSNITFIGRRGLELKTEAGVTSSSYTPCGWEKYVRVKSVQAADASKIAWSQPISVSIV